MGAGQVRRFSLTALARFAATALVVLWCAQPALLVLHARAHTHQFCAVHNAFEEAGPTARASDSRDATTALEADDAAAQDAAALPGEHQTCPTAAATWPQMVRPADVVLAVAVPLQGVTQSLWAHAPASSPLRVLDVAPKASPPV